VALLEGLDGVIIEVAQALIPLLVFFLGFQFFYLKLPRGYIVNLTRGILFTAIGMILLLQGVRAAFIPAGHEIGEALATLDQQWIFLPFGFFLGFLTTYAEPAVRVLCYQVEEASSGSIRQSLILYALSLGVAVSVACGMLRLVYGISLLCFVIPGYVLALILLHFSDEDFIGVAFDSGGVATGPMAVTFLLSLAVGVAAGIEGRDPVVDGFGLIALIALAPILSVLILGIFYRRRKGETR